MKIGDRVEAGWLGRDIDGYTGPLGVVVGLEGNQFIVRWDNNFIAAFPRVELRAVYPGARRQDAHTTRFEPVGYTECQDTP